MQWNSPIMHSRRTVKQFAWSPTRMCDGTIVWLERYCVDQSYYYVMSDGYGWQNVLLYSQRPEEKAS